MKRDYCRNPNFLRRSYLRTLYYGERLVVQGLTLSALRSARVACFDEGKQRHCYFRLASRQRDDELYDVVIERLSLLDALRQGLLRGERKRQAEDWAERQRNYYPLVHPRGRDEIAHRPKSLKY